MTLGTVVPAHAKVNLALRVLRREPDGYHRIETIFQRLALHDDVRVVRTPAARSLVVRWDGIPAVDLGPPEQNLAWRAAQAFVEAAGGPSGWSIEITKRIPAGGGLGGGSADAAAAFRALNGLTPRPLATATLHRLAAALGSDVPFLAGTAALALGTGRGDALTALPALPSAPVLLVLPDFGVNTAAAYHALAAARLAQATAVPSSAFDGTGWHDWAAVQRRQVNDFEATVFAAHPVLGRVREALAAAGAIVARLSGSGSVLFGVWPPGGEPPTSLDVPSGWRTVRTATLADGASAD